MKYCVFEFPDFFNHFRILYGIPEAREVSKNLPGARGVVFPKCQPIPSNGDPIHPQNYQISSNSHLPDHYLFFERVLIFYFLVATLSGLDPSQKMHIDCPHLQKRGYGGSISQQRLILLGFSKFQEGRFLRILYGNNIFI